MLATNSAPIRIRSSCSQVPEPHPTRVHCCTLWWITSFLVQATRGRPMFSIIRFILVVGVIFYYSPVRQQGEGLAAVDAWLTPKKGEPAAAPPAPSSESHPGHLETVWQALPNGAKQAVIDKILTTSGLTPPEAKAADTLQAGDRQPRWRGEVAKPRS